MVAWPRIGTAGFRWIRAGDDAAGGAEFGYSWLEGYNVALRVGARRPEADSENPISLGGAFTADRITVEYAVRFVDGGRASHGVTVRWR